MPPALRQNSASTWSRPTTPVIRKVLPRWYRRCPPASPSRGEQNGKTVRDYLQMTRDVIDAGAAGVTYGRFVFQYRDVTALVKTLGQVIHRGLSVKEAAELLEQLENDNK